MKLITAIRPRKDDTVDFVGPSKSRYVFVREGADLVAEVGVVEDARAALATGNFYPATETDEAAAAALGGEDEMDDDGDGMSPDLNALPVEAHTLPRRRGRRPAVTQE